VKFLARIAGRTIAPVCLAVVQLVLVGPAHAALSNIPSSPLVTDGNVTAFAKSGNTLYIGGSFERIGMRTGPLVTTDASTGDLEPGLPVVSGNFGWVAALVPDGAGGWYIGGSFTHVGAAARSNLAHVLADGSVDPSFNPAPDATVRSLVLSGSTLFAGGDFQTIGGQSRTGLAALNATTGNATSWAPNPDSDVGSMALSAGTLYVAGDFSNIGATPQARAGLAAVDTSTGNATSWNPNPTDPDSVNLNALAVSGSTVYVAGRFSSIGATPAARHDLAAVNATTGDATSWAPNPTSGSDPEESGVEAIAVAPSGNTVYVGGVFDHIGATPVARSDLAAVDAGSGDATGWHPDPDGQVQGIFLGGSNAYVTGPFAHIGQSSPVARRGLAAIDTSTGNATGWNPDPDDSEGDVSGLAVSGSHVILAGAFDSFRGAPRDGLAAVDVSTGQLLPWNPGPTSSGGFPFVTTLAVAGSTVYVGGQFDEIGRTTRVPRTDLAAVDASTGETTGWDPQPDGPIGQLVTDGSTVWTAGSFSHIGTNNAPRAGLAAINAGSGAATTWDPNPDSVVFALALGGSTLYVGGEFSTLDGQSRSLAGAFDTATGNLTGWDPAVDSSPNAIVPDGSKVYIGGSFGHLGGDPHTGLARVNATTGAVDSSWDPIVDDSVGAIALHDGLVYFAGVFGHVDSASRVAVAAVDASTGTDLDAFDPFGSTTTGPSVAAILGGDSPDQLFVGGQFGSLDLAPNRSLALFGVPAPNGSGGGAGIGGSGNPGSGGSQTKHKIKLSLKISRRQHVIRQHGLIVSASSDQAGTVVLSATVSVPKGAKVVRFKTVRKKVKAGKRVKVKLTLSKHNLALLKRALRHRRLTARVRVSARATAHPSSNKSVKVRLLR
jgi:hypothetical protein